MDSSSIVIPSVGIATNNSLQILVRNDSQKKIIFKPKTLTINVELVNEEDIFSLQNPEGRKIILDSKTRPLLFIINPVSLTDHIRIYKEKVLHVLYF